MLYRRYSLDTWQNWWLERLHSIWNVPPIDHARIQRSLLAWGSTHALSLPWRDPIPSWQALVVESMLQRTRATQVLPVFEKLRNQYPNLGALALASDSDLRELFWPLGLRWRIEKLIELCHWIVERQGQVPETDDELQALPGIGPYASSAFLSLHRGKRAIILDANVVRVLCRLVGKSTGPEVRRERWLIGLAASLTPIRRHRAYGYAILDLGISVCRPSRPRCGRCPVSKHCRWFQSHHESNSPLTSEGRLPTLHAPRASGSRRYDTSGIAAKRSAEKLPRVRRGNASSTR